MAGGAIMKKEKTMVAQVKEYIAYKRKLGFQLRQDAGRLLNFAKYADESGHTGPVTIELVLKWASLPKKASQSNPAYRVGIVRCFAKYQAIFFFKNRDSSVTNTGTGLSSYRALYLLPAANFSIIGGLYTINTG